MSEVFVCAKGTLTAASKRELRAAGIVVVESTSPHQCRLIEVDSPAGGIDLLSAALRALNADVGADVHAVGQRHRARFTSYVAAQVTAKQDGAS